MTYRALIPVKSLSEVKSRLALHLSQTERSQLVLRMLHHVLQTLQASEQFERITVVSPDERVLMQTREWGACAIKEEQPGHNPALTAAAYRELTTGATALLTISADLPLLDVQHVQDLVQESWDYDVILAPSRDGTGTNALLTRPPLGLPYVFGVGSLQRYQQEIRRRHLRSAIYSSNGFAFDVDTIDDLEEYQHYMLCVPSCL